MLFSGRLKFTRRYRIFLLFSFLSSLLRDDCFNLQSDTFEEVFRGLRRFPSQCFAPLCLAA